MYKPDFAPKFKKDIKRIEKKHWDVKLLNEAITVVVKSDELEIPYIFNDHSLSGNLQGYRQLHIDGRSSNWLLRYRIHDGVVYFVRTGTHDELD